MASFLDSLKEKTGNLFDKIPLLASEAKEGVKDFFTPDANPDVRIGEFLREVPGATGDVAKEIAQGTLRSLDFLGRKILPGDELKDEPSELESTIEDFLFGGREKRGESFTDVGEVELGLDREKHPLLTPFAGAGIIGLDLIPGGQGKSAGFKQFLKSMTDDAVTTLAKMTDEKQITAFIKESAPKMKDAEVKTITDTLKTTKTNDEVIGAINNIGQTVATKGADEIVPADKKIKVVKKTTPEYIVDVNKPIKVFRGEGAGIGNSTLTKGKYFAGDEDFAKTFGGDVTTETIPKGVKMFDFDVIKENPNQTLVPEEFLVDPEQMRQYLIDNGFEYTRNTNTRGVEYVQLLTPEVKEVQELIKFARSFDDSTDFLEAVTTGQNFDKYRGGVDGYKKFYTNKSGGSTLSDLWNFANDKAPTGVDISTKSTNKIPTQLTDGLPEQSAKNVAEASVQADKEITKALSPRRSQDMREAGISEDVFGQALYSKAGGRLTHDEAGELADNLRAPIKDLIEKSPREFELSRPKIEAYSQELQGYFENVVKKLKAQALANPKDNVLQDQYTRASGQYIKARATLEALISEAGRIVEGSKVIGKYSRLPGMDGKIRVVRDNIVGFANKNPEKHGNLPAEFDMAIEGVDVNNATELLDFLTEWNRSSFLRKLSEFQKASMLSGLSTQGVNALGNLIQQILDIPVRLLAGGLDVVRAGVTRTPREVYAGEALAQVKGAMRAMPDALTRAVKALGNEHYAQELRRTEIEAGTVVPAIRGKFGKVVRIPFRFLQSFDLLFRTSKTGAEKLALSHRLAKHEGLTGKAFKDRVAELEKNLPADMLDMVDARAERSLMLEELEGGLKTIEDAKNAHPTAQFVIPFYRTLVNLSREAYRMTPIGGVGRTVGRVTGSKKTTEAFSNKWTKDKNTRMEELSRQIIGTSIMALVVTKMLDGEIEITGGAPSKAGDREIFYGSGKQPHSIRIGDNWIPFSKIQPIGQLIQLGAGVSEMIEAHRNTGGLNEEEVGKATAKAVGDIASMVFTQSPFTGLGDFMNLLKGGQYNEGYGPALNRYTGQLAGTFIPNIIRRHTVGLDPVIYEKRDIKSQLRSRFPGLEDELTPKRTLFGEKVLKDGNYLTRFASPIEPSPIEENKIYEEFDRIGYTPTIPDRKAYGQKLSVEEYEILQLMYGPVLREELTSLMETSRYKRQNDAIKHKILDKISGALLKRAEAQLFPTYRQRKAQHAKLILQGYVTSEKTLSAEGQAILDNKFPVTPEESATYARTVLQEALQSGDAEPTIQQLLNQ